ncbi:MAG: succinyl-diaminopimelate desuccinylase [Frankiaceae bacterium]|nr:succinyl-diaminopimelate desuccinylase [Frankiaceae bacterium]
MIAAPLDLTDPVSLTEQLVALPSVSGDEQLIADTVEQALESLDGLRIERDGDALVARTELGLPTRVLLAGHLDTVPIADNVPGSRADGRLFGCGTTDMKSGVAVMLVAAAAALASPQGPAHDLTLVCYDQEEVEEVRNGLRRLAAADPARLGADLAILLEPTDGTIEAGCQGTCRAEVTVPGRRAHSARSWLGENAIHAAGPLLERLRTYEPRSVTLDGCTYREGLSAVRISGGVAGNVIPDACTVTINFRFAPDRSEDEAHAHVREVVTPLEAVFVDSAPGALPGLSAPAAADFVRTIGQEPRAKYGWTDVSRFAALGIPAVNFGPGDPNLAHTREESVDIEKIRVATAQLTRFLSRESPSR